MFEKTRLLFYAYMGNEKAVQKCLNQGIDSDAMDRDGWTALTYAARNGNVEVARILIENNAGCGIKNTKGFTPLQIAQSFGHQEVVELIQSELNRQLIRAVIEVDLSATEAALIGGANSDCIGVMGYRVLGVAIQSGSLDIVKLLMNYEVEVNDTYVYGWTPIALAVDGNHFEITKLLLEANADPTIQINNNSLLDIAKRHQEPKLLSLLSSYILFEEPTLSHTDQTLTASASLSDSSDYVVAPCPIEPEGTVSYAEDNNNKSLLKSLETKYAIECLICVLQGRITQLSLEVKAYSEIRLNNISTLTNTANQHPKPELPHPLLTDKDSVEPTAKDTSIASVSLTNNTVLSQIPEEKVTVPHFDLTVNLFKAIIAGDGKTVVKLLRLGVDINYQDRAGTTALMIAAEKGNLKLVELLLEKKADIGLRNVEGKTAFDLANQNQHKGLLKLLITQSANEGLFSETEENIILQEPETKVSLVVQPVITPIIAPQPETPKPVVNVPKPSLLTSQPEGYLEITFLNTTRRKEPLRVVLHITQKITPPSRWKRYQQELQRLILLPDSDKRNTELINLLNKNKGIFNEISKTIVKWNERKSCTSTNKFDTVWRYRIVLLRVIFDYIDRKDLSQTVEELNDLVSIVPITQSHYDAWPNLPETQNKLSPFEQHIQELQNLIGLDNIKDDVVRLVNFVKFQDMRRRKGYSVPDNSLHMVFTGNPGTGKTSIARLIAKIYEEMGILTKGHFVEVDRAGLVAEYLGQTAIKTQKVVKDALGGVLFIDEAYSLTNSEQGNDEYGKEAVNTLLKLMEDHRNNLIVIVAGYTEPMQQFVSSNPGLQSRFNKFLHFKDYTPAELTEIFIHFAAVGDYKLSPEAVEECDDIFSRLYESRDETFGNARLARNMYEQTISNHANRLINSDAIDDDDMNILNVEDIPNPMREAI